MDNSKLTNKPALTDKTRRNFITGISAIFGAAGTAQLLGGNAISVAVAYTPNPNSTKTAGKIYSQTQMIQLREICAVVIPKTETPGAAEVDAHGFVDNQLFHCHTKEQQLKATAILKKIEENAIKQFDKSFSAIAQQQKFDLLTSLEKAENGFSDEDRWHFKFIKGLIIFGYYTSEPGATKELEYVMVPGGFTGSIPYDSVGKGPGSLAYY
jgi:hypothetical protein